VCSEVLRWHRRLRKPLISGVVPASGQTKPLTVRTGLRRKQRTRPRVRPIQYPGHPVSRRAVLGPQRVDEPQGMAAPGAADSRRGRCRIGSRPCSGSGGALGSAKLPHRVACLAVSRAQQAVIPDLDTRVRQDRRPQPADACLGTAGAALGVLGLGRLVWAGDRTIFKVEEAVMADGHAQEVGRPLLEGVSASAHRCTRHHPVPCPALTGDTVKHGGLSQRRAECGTTHEGKCLDRPQEIVSGWPPGPASPSPPARGPQVVPRGMGVQRPGPGVPNPAHPDRASDHPGLAGELVEGCC